MEGVVAAPGTSLLYALVDDRAEVRIIDLDALTVTGSVDVPDHHGNALAIAPDGKRLYVAHDEGVAEVDTATRTVERTLTYGSGSQVYGLALSADSRFLAPVLGSWFPRMRAAAGRATRSPAAREAVRSASHTADARFLQSTRRRGNRAAHAESRPAHRLAPADEGRCR
ncbi:hypothetical protein RB200_06680 [Streptomyces sp. PmtG]